MQLYVKTVMVTSVSEQVRAFREGFSSVFPVEDLLVFSPLELDILINGSDEVWDQESNTNLSLFFAAWVFDMALIKFS